MKAPEMGCFDGRSRPISCCPRSEAPLEYGHEVARRPALEDAPPAPPPEWHAAAQRQANDVPIRLKPCSHGKAPVLHCGGGSHKSGMDRMWVDCLDESHRREGCVTYRPVHHFASRQECAIWLCAWALCPGQIEESCRTRSEHVPCPVPERVVTVASQNYIG